MNKSENINELAKSLAIFQTKVKQPLKDANNPFFKSKYVPLQNVVQAVTETAGELGLSFIQYPVNEENKIGVITLLMHESGQYIETDPIFTHIAKQDPQAVGSAISYMKRYSLSAVFGITADLDDDAESAMDRSNSTQQPRQQYQRPQQQSPAQQDVPKMISPPQLKAVQTKVGIIAKRDNSDAKDVYAQAIEFCQIKPGTSSKDLTIGEATKLIGYLATLEQQ